VTLAKQEKIHPVIMVSKQQVISQ